MVCCVLFYAGQRRTVNIDSNSASHVLLNEAVKEFSLVNTPPHSSYIMTFKNRQIDLSMTLKQLGISTNAIIEISNRTSTDDTKVKIALGLPGGKRLIQDKVPASSTLLEVLTIFSELDSDALPLSIVADGTVMYVRQNFSGEELASTTLASIGLISGSARLSFIPGTGATTLLTSDPPKPTAERTGDSSASQTIETLPPSSSSLLSSSSSAPLPAVSTNIISQDMLDVDTEVTKLRAKIAELVAAEDYYAAGELKKKIDDILLKTAQSSVHEERSKAAQTPPPLSSLSSSLSSTSLSSASVSASSDNVSEEQKEAVMKALYVLNSSEENRTALLQCLTTILKYYANVINAPYDDRPRMIRVGNKAFKERVASFSGGVQAMRSVGFSKQVIGEPHEIAQDKVACTWFVLPSNYSEPLLRFAFDEYVKFTVLQGVPREKLPSVIAPVNREAFNPFKASFTSMGDPRIHSKQKSVTDTKLEQLTNKRDALLKDSPIPERNFRIYPSSYGDVSTSLSPDMSSSLSARAASSEDFPSDSKLLAQAYASSMAATKKEEDVPFKTKAMRQVDELERKLVYVSTAIKLVFPGKVVATLSLHPTETVEDLKLLVKSLLITGENRDGDGPSSVPLVGFDLFTTPPRKSLPTSLPSPSMTSMGFVPTALIYVSWLKPKEDISISDAQDCEHWFLNEKARTIMAETVTNRLAPAFPSGISLATNTVPKKDVSLPAEPKESGRKRKTDGSSKPAWMKL